MSASRTASGHLLIVEDDPVDATLLGEMLENLDEYWTHSVEASVNEALKSLEESRCDLVLLDLGLPDSEGLEGCQQLFLRFPRIPIVLLTGRDDRELARQALDGLAQDYLIKGRFRPEELARVLRHAVARSQVDQNLRMALKLCADGILVLASGVVLFANDSFGGLMGRDSTMLIGKPFAEPTESEWTLPSGQVLETRGHPITWNGHPAKLYSFRDITRRKRALEEAAQSQKLAAVGKLAGGIAQDFNNLLVGIKSQAELIEAGALETQELSKAARDVLMAADRAAILTRRLLGFAQQGKFQSLPVDMHTIIDEALSCSPEGVHLELNLDAESSLVEGDASQLSQVVSDLALNAQEAMNHVGRLTVCTKNEGLQTIVEFEDTGPGISLSIRDRVFEPFVTTKPLGEGLGMGLAMAFGVMKNHNGLIEVESPEKGGCCVRLRLPTLQSIPRPSRLPERRVNGNLVLVIDDDKVVLRTVSRLLQRMDMVPVCASSGAEGLRHFRESHPSIQFVLLDWRMPEMSGEMCLEHLRGINPDIPVMIVSGYAEETLGAQVDGLLRKPFGFQEFQKAITAFQPVP